MRSRMLVCLLLPFACATSARPGPTPSRPPDAGCAACDARCDRPLDDCFASPPSRTDSGASGFCERFHDCDPSTDVAACEAEPAAEGCRRAALDACAARLSCQDLLRDGRMDFGPLAECTRTERQRCEAVDN